MNDASHSLLRLDEATTISATANTPQHSADAASLLDVPVSAFAFWASDSLRKVFGLSDRLGNIDSLSFHGNHPSRSCLGWLFSALTSNREFSGFSVAFVSMPKSIFVTPDKLQANRAFSFANLRCTVLTYGSVCLDDLHV